MRFIAQQRADREAVGRPYETVGAGSEEIEEPQQHGRRALIRRTPAPFESPGEPPAIAQSVREQRQCHHRERPRQRVVRQHGDHRLGAMLPDLIQSQKP